ncbi:hypothetical protein ACH4ND_14955 [Streptomyces sp. NPDC017179]|uniref:hypothetical protein n=1 Tax=Streptomyces sp. NPDC017179 TaxID=3364979 RepID=UPI0037AA0FA5
MMAIIAHRIMVSVRATAQRARAVLFSDLGNKIADQGWVRFPAYTPEERRRLVAVAHRLTAYWGQQVLIEAEDPLPRQALPRRIRSPSETVAAACTAVDETSG